MEETLMSDGPHGDDRSTALRLFSILLRYPDGALTAALDEIEAAADRLAAADLRRPCRGLVAYLKKTPLLGAQEAYTAAFDLDPKGCLNLTYHRWGDGKERGEALAAFRRMYAQGGCRPATPELPDYLPMVLEMISRSGGAPPEPARGYGPEIEAVAARLRESGSPWAPILTAAAGLIRPPNDPQRSAS